MSRNLILSSLILLLFIGCSGPVDNNICTDADIIEHGPDQIEIRFCKRSWGGVVGPHGYVGFITTGYGAALEGKGPIFVNPKFQDNPPDSRCIGIITLDRIHNRVIVDMQRIMSKPGEPEQTKPHPANGTYVVKSVRKAMPDEQKWFRQWIAQGVK
jgi:hypothetical protein